MLLVVLAVPVILPRISCRVLVYSRKVQHNNTYMHMYMYMYMYMYIREDKCSSIPGTSRWARARPRTHNHRISTHAG